MTALLLVPLLLPLLGGIGIFFLKFPTQRGRECFTLCVSLFTSLAVGALLLLRPAGTLTLVRLTDEISLSLRLDGLGCIFLALIAFLWPLATLYAFEYMREERELPRFFAFYTISYGVTAGVALSADLLTLYLFYELLTLATLPLVVHERTRRAMKAGRKYLLYSISGAALSFVGIVMLCTHTGFASFTPGGVGERGMGDPLLLVAYFFTFAGFGVKAAIFPLHDWLPSAGVAPTPVTALLHAVAVVKSGVFACIRSTFYAFGTRILAGTWVQKTALLTAAFTIVYGSVMAFREQHWKRRLAYSTVSNLSYILFGMALMTTGGLIAALSHMVFHGIMKITLFFCAGTVLCKTGREYIPETEGLGRRMPVTFAVYTLAGLALTGTPLLPGFISKLNLINAAADASCGWYGMAGIIALLLSALLTAAYLIPMSLRAFLPREGAAQKPGEKDRDPGVCMILPFVILCAAMLLLGTHAGPVLRIIEQAVTAGMGGI